MPSTVRIVIFKLLQAALLGAGLYMQYNSMEIFKHTTLLLSCSAIGGYLIVVVGMILAAIFQQPVPKRADMLYNLMGACIFGATGYFVLEYFYIDQKSTIGSILDQVKRPMSDEERNIGMAKAGGCFTVALIFLVDFVATLRE